MKSQRVKNLQRNLEKNLQRNPKTTKILVLRAPLMENLRVQDHDHVQKLQKAAGGMGEDVDKETSDHSRPDLYAHLKFSSTFK